jgi:hypothetical protein
MISRSLNNSNDLYLLNGRIAVVSEGEQVLQHVRTRLLTYQEEWFLDTRAGIPYFQNILIKPANLSGTEALIKTEILQTPDVLSLSAFGLEFDAITRTLNITFTALTAFGDVSGVLKMNQTTAQIQAA